MTCAHGCGRPAVYTNQTCEVCGKTEAPPETGHAAERLERRIQGMHLSREILLDKIASLRAEVKQLRAEVQRLSDERDEWHNIAAVEQPAVHRAGIAAIWAEVVALVETLREPLPSGDYARGRSHMHAEILAALRDQASKPQRAKFLAAK